MYVMMITIWDCKLIIIVRVRKSIKIEKIVYIIYFLCVLYKMTDEVLEQNENMKPPNIIKSLKTNPYRKKVSPPKQPPVYSAPNIPDIPDAKNIPIMEDRFHPIVVAMVHLRKTYQIDIKEWNEIDWKHFFHILNTVKQHYGSYTEAWNADDKTYANEIKENPRIFFEAWTNWIDKHHEKNFLKMYSDKREKLDIIYKKILYFIPKCRDIEQSYKDTTVKIDHVQQPQDVQTNEMFEKIYNVYFDDKGNRQKEIHVPEEYKSFLPDKYEDLPVGIRDKMLTIGLLKLKQQRVQQASRRFGDKLKQEDSPRSKNISNCIKACEEMYKKLETVEYTQGDDRIYNLLVKFANEYNKLNKLCEEIDLYSKSGEYEEFFGKINIDANGCVEFPRWYLEVDIYKICEEFRIDSFTAELFIGLYNHFWMNNYKHTYMTYNSKSRNAPHCYTNHYQISDNIIEIYNKVYINCSPAIEVGDEVTSYYRSKSKPKVEISSMSMIKTRKSKYIPTPENLRASKKRKIDIRFANLRNSKSKSKGRLDNISNKTRKSKSNKRIISNSLQLLKPELENNLESYNATRRRERSL